MYAKFLKYLFMNLMDWERNGNFKLFSAYFDEK